MSKDRDESRRYESDTDLSLCKNWPEKKLEDAGNTGRPDVQYKIYGIKGIRLNKDGGDSLAHTTNSRRCPQGFSDVPVVPDEPYHDHEGKDEVERKSNRNEWSAEMSYREGIPCDAIRSRQLVDKRDTHCFLPRLS